MFQINILLKKSLAHPKSTAYFTCSTTLGIVANPFNLQGFLDLSKNPCNKLTIKHYWSNSNSTYVEYTSTSINLDTSSNCFTIHKMFTTYWMLYIDKLLQQLSKPWLFSIQFTVLHLRKLCTQMYKNIFGVILHNIKTRKREHLEPNYNQ